VELMLLELLNTTVKTTNCCKHLIVFLLIAISLHHGLISILLYFGDNLLMRRYNLLVISEGLLKLAASCNSLQSQSLLTLDFIRKILDLLPKTLIIPLSFPHYLFSLIKLILNEEPLLGLLSKHGRQQLGVLSNLLQLTSKLSLVDDCFLELRLVHFSQSFCVFLLNSVLTGQLLNFCLSILLASKQIVSLKGQSLIQELKFVESGLIVVDLPGGAVIL